MRYLFIGIFVFLAWSAGSAWWYACKIKGVCPISQIHTTDWDFGELPDHFRLSYGDEFLWESDKLILFRVGDADPVLPEDFAAFVSTLEEYLATHPSSNLFVTGFADEREGDSPLELAQSRAEYLQKRLSQYSPNLPVFKNQGEIRPLVFTPEGVTAGGFALAINEFIAEDIILPEDPNPLFAERDEPIATNEPPVKEVEPVTPPVKTEPTPPASVPASPPNGQNPGKRSIYFSLTQPVIPSASSFNQYIDATIAFVKAHPGKKVRISGHTDDTATPDANKSLGQMRADIIAQRFLDRGLSSADMVVVSMGEKEPVASNETGEGRAQNRRVDIEIR